MSEDLMAEAYRRNLLPPDKKAAYEEAMRRGIVQAPSDYQTILNAVSGVGEKTIENILTAGKNIPSSAANYVGNIYQAVRHPIVTAKTLGDVALGLAQLAVPGEQPNEELVAKIGNFYKDRYGSLENVRKTMINDPVGFAADLSMALNLAGGTAQVAGRAATSPSLIMAGEAVSSVGRAVDPITIAQQAVKSTVNLLPKNTEATLYTSAAKYPAKIPGEKTEITPEKALSISNKALDKKLLFTNETRKKLAQSYKESSSKVDDLIDSATRSRDKIKVDDILKPLDDLDQYYQSAPELGGKIWHDKIQEIKQANISKFGTEVTPAEAQKLKKIAQGMARKNYGEWADSEISQAVSKTIATGAKEALEAKYPELKNLNPQSAEALELNKVLGKSIRRIKNRDIFGIGLPLKTMSGAAVDYAAGTGGIGTAVGFLTWLIDQPNTKAAIAIALRSARNMKPAETLGKTKAAAGAAFQAGRFEDVINDRTPKYKPRIYE